MCVVTSKNNNLPLIYVCSKYSGDTASNTESAKRYSRFVVEQSAIPFAPHLLLPLYMCEESERELAMLMDMVFLEKCDELWVFGEDVSEGMRREIAKAEEIHKRIRFFDNACNEANTHLEFQPERIQEDH